MAPLRDTPPTTPTAIDGLALGELIPSWDLSLRASNKSPRTVRTYGDDARLLASYLEAIGYTSVAPAITREHVELFVADQLNRHKASSAAVRYRFGLRVNGGFQVRAHSEW